MIIPATSYTFFVIKIMQQNEEIHTSPEYTETSFPIESSITPTESFEKDQTQQVSNFCKNIHYEFYVVF